MNQLFVIYYPVFGGPHNQALRLNTSLAERGWKTLVLLPDEPGNAAERLWAGNVQVVQMPLHRLRASPDPRLQLSFMFSFALEVTRIRRVIREQRIDLVLIGGLVNPHAALAARLEGVPVAWQLLDTRPPMLLRRVVMPLVTRLSDVVMSTGIGVARVHPGALGLGEQLVPFFPPVDTLRFQPRPEEKASLRAEWGVPADTLVLGTVANINPQKGIGLLIDAYTLVRQQVEQLKLVLVGAEYDTHRDYSRQIREQMRTLGLQERVNVIFAGARADIHRQLQGLDVFVLGSMPRSEGIPTVILEAMACGLPTVATDVGAVREVVEDGVTGFVVPPLDPEAIARATLRVIQDPVLRARMGAEGRRRAVERYNVEACADTHVRAFAIAIAHQRVRRAVCMSDAVSLPTTPAAVPVLHHLLVCPSCRGPLAWSAEQICCQACPCTYPVVDGIPVLLLNQAEAEHDELDHHAHDHKHRQANFFDRQVAAEFEITRPHGTPGLYRELLSEKFRRSVMGLESLLLGATALTVCGGSGMDAEFLARTGARVIASDISLGAARRVRERTRRYGLAITPLVADVERLPFPDRAVDLVYVHDGLHHLEQPLAGLAEMARVAARAVSVTEPARAAATALAVRLGLALEREQAGNRVARLMPDEVAGELQSRGFRILHADRYAMYYRHGPGPVLRALSSPGLVCVSRAAISLGNVLIGRWGNKLRVTALKRE